MLPWCLSNSYQSDGLKQISRCEVLNRSLPASRLWLWKFPRIGFQHHRAYLQCGRRPNLEAEWRFHPTNRGGKHNKEKHVLSGCFYPQGICNLSTYTRVLPAKSNQIWATCWDGPILICDWAILNPKSFRLLRYTLGLVIDKKEYRAQDQGTQKEKGFLFRMFHGHPLSACDQIV